MTFESNFIHASIDNFDLNEDTLSGKNTTHSMAMVLFQKKSSISTFVRENILRGGAYSLGTPEENGLNFQNILKYVKPVFFFFNSFFNFILKI